MLNGISIVVCTYNGGTRLKETLEHLVKLRSDFTWEVLVVDNNSTDESTDVAYQILSNSLVSFRIISESNSGLSFARWRGVTESRYDLILFCDDDNHLQEDFLTIGYEVFSKNPNCGILGSKGVKKITGKEPEWFERFSHSYAVGTLGKKNGPQPKGSYHYGAACFFRKSVLEELVNIGFQSILRDRSGTSLSSGGDVELCMAVQLLGFELWFDDRLEFHHYIEPHRLQWSYYLKLKIGIASSFPLLESYRIEEFVDFREFENFLKREFHFTWKGVLKSGLFLLLKKDKLHEVNFLTSSTKFKAYFKNRKAAIESFERNKRIFVT